MPMSSYVTSVSDFILFLLFFFFFFFFFQAEDGIRDKLVTGVQTCALPISMSAISFSERPDGGAPCALGDDAGELSAETPARCSGRTTSEVSKTARRMTFRSSRTFPGHG